MSESHDNVNIYSLPDNLFSIPDNNVVEERELFLSPQLYSQPVAQSLIDIARALVNPRGKGIYATDEAPYAIAAALASAHGDPLKGKTFTEAEHLERRKQWHQFSYEAIPHEYISGVILFAETLLDFRQAPILSQKGIIPGVRANGELAPFPFSPYEFIVQGLDDLLSKLQAARAAGARFSKWRVPIACTSVERGFPTQLALEAQAETLARFASISQEAGLVPIVEPDVEFSEDADLARSLEVHETAIGLIYMRCRAYKVLIEGTLIKPSFPQPGRKHPSRTTVIPSEIALATATLISRTVPSAVPGVMFLSGGLEPEVATAWLSAVNALVNSSPPGSTFSRLPSLSFSFGRALQGDAMKCWVRGDEDGAKKAFEKWSKACYQAAKGLAA